MAFFDYHPPVNEFYYELWLEGGGLILKLPLYAVNMRVGETVFIDDDDYKIESIEHRLTSLADWPGPEPPAYDTGFSYVLCKIWVSVIV